MDNLLDILTKPDNLPIVGMALSLVFLLGVWLKQALLHDKLIADGRPEDVAREMRK